MLLLEQSGLGSVLLRAAGAKHDASGRDRQAASQNARSRAQVPETGEPGVLARLYVRRAARVRYAFRMSGPRFLDHDPAPGANPAPGGATERLALAALLLATVLSGLLCVFPELDFDLWWHLRTGRLIVEERSIPTADPFTFTAEGRPWVTHEWLAEVLFYGVHELGGIDALVLMKAVIAALALLLSAAAGLSDDGRSRLAAAAVGVLAAAPLLQPRAFVRPHMLTALLLGAVLLCLRREAVTRQRVWRAALLPIFLLWANLHSGFVLGLGLVALFWIGEAWESGGRDLRGGGRPVDRRARNAAVWLKLRSRGSWFAALLAVGLVNPHLHRAFLYPFDLMARREVREAIVELRSIFHPAYADALFLKALAAAAVIMLALVWSERRCVHWSMVLPGALFAGLAVNNLRGVSEFAVMVPAFMAVHGGVFARRPAWSRAVSLAVILLAAAGGAAALRWGVPMGADPPRRIALGHERDNLPDAATRFLRDAAPPGRVFNLLAFGGWFIHELWPDRRVYIDGRLDVFPPGFLAAYQTLMRTSDGWDRAVAQYDIAFAVVNYAADPLRDAGLRARLRSDPEWVVVCFADNLVVYARRVPVNADLVKSFGCPFDPSLRTPASLVAWLELAAAPDVIQAAAAITRMLPFVAEAKAPRAVLIPILLRAADLELERDDRGGAKARLEQALALDPRLALAHMRLGILHAQTGDITAARRHLDAARSLSPHEPAIERNLELLESMGPPR